MGAAISTRAAADDPRIAALVLESPYVDLEATLAIVLRRKQVPLPIQNGTVDAEFKVKQAKPGLYRYEVRAEPLPDLERERAGKVRMIEDGLSQRRREDGIAGRDRLRFAPDRLPEFLR